MTSSDDNLFDLSGRVALITGGNGGLGLGMALGLANAGADIAIAARNAEKNAAALGPSRRPGVTPLRSRRTSPAIRTSTTWRPERWHISDTLTS